MTNNAPFQSWSVIQTYEDLLTLLLTLTPEQLDCTPRIYCPDANEYYPITTVSTASDVNQVLNENHPYLGF